MPKHTRKLVLRRETLRSVVSSSPFAKPAPLVDTVLVDATTGEETCINPACGSLAV